ncbi:MAG: hypothetical protein M0P91_04085 [Sulfuricurvum sp.]|jgi:hypothetical protein|uniref:hypothetical protein n=1 Tax=Sulfuricurvum sp. TaxID=2025608 RepID=UPI0025F2F3A0|nr:hypothetical protein [Sulfuricurvum sp.]MCK9372352.1 hypothetical protein [Sulfuricurvum sp.]
MKRLIYAFYIALIVVVLIPKEKLYFTLESILSEYTVYLTDENLSNHFFYLDAMNSNLLLDNIQIGSIEQIRIIPWVVYNRLTVSNVTFSSLYHSVFPGKIEEISLTYSLLHPLSVHLQATGDFGRCEGGIDLAEQKIRLLFEATPELRNYPLLVFKLQQVKEGLVYESNF